MDMDRDRGHSQFVDSPQVEPNGIRLKVLLGEGPPRAVRLEVTVTQIRTDGDSAIARYDEVVMVPPQGQPIDVDARCIPGSPEFEPGRVIAVAQVSFHWAKELRAL